MNCSSCGKKIAKTSKFCPNCGMKIEEVSDAKSEEVKEEKDNIVEEKIDDVKGKEESSVNVVENTVDNSSNNNTNTVNIKNSNGAFVASIVVTILSLLTLNFTALTFSIIAIVYLSICKNETNIDLKQRKIHNGKVLNIISWVIFGIGVIIRIICLVLILLPIIFFNEYNDGPSERDDYWEDYYDEDNTYDDEYANLIEVDFDRFMVLYRRSTPSVVVLVQTTCGYCNMYKPIIDEIAYDENINIYYLDITKLTNSEYNQLINNVDFFEENTSWGTPTTLIVKDSSTIDYLAGYTNSDTTLRFYRKNSIIK